MITDVSKLSANEKIKNTIEKKIVNYIDCGGGMIGTHDIIYKRTRNQMLENIFGCTLNNFRRTKIAIKYKKNPSIKLDFFTSLPDTFSLDDGEICWGCWENDVKYIFQTDEKKPKPVVVSRDYGKGKIIWMNSADKSDKVARSISEPEDIFICLLACAIQYVIQKEI
jgi:glycerophosphoryl diester phosphodiesterase